MKRIVLFSFIALLTTVAFAQKPSLSKAYNLYYEKNYEKAKEAIDLCTQDEKLATKAQTWLYKGNIYLFLANSEYGEKQKNAQYVIKYPDTPVEAYEAFQKALAINANAEAMDMYSAKDALQQLYALLLIRGVDQLIAKDYVSAKATLSKGISSYEMGTPQIPMNGDLYYYYAYTLEMLGQKDSLTFYYEKAVKDNSVNPYVYVRLIDNYKNAGNRSKTQETLNLAKSRIANDVNIALSEIDYYYWTGDSAKAKSLLGNISESQLTTEDEMVNLANFYIKEKRYEDADRLLRRANAKSNGNFIILYNLGVCNYSISENYFNEWNKNAVNSQQDPSNLNYLKEQSNNYLQRAADYFEQAREIQPNDLGLLTTLRAIYARMQSPNYETIDQLIKRLEK